MTKGNRSFYTGATEEAQRATEPTTLVTVRFSQFVKIDFAEQLRTVWGPNVLSDAEVRAMRDAELGSRS